jgi:hypothetical protein
MSAYNSLLRPAYSKAMADSMGVYFPVEPAFDQLLFF